MCVSCEAFALEVLVDDLLSSNQTDVSSMATGWPSDRNLLRLVDVRDCA